MSEYHDMIARDHDRHKQAQARDDTTRWGHDGQPVPPEQVDTADLVHWPEAFGEPLDGAETPHWRRVAGEWVPKGVR